LLFDGKTNKGWRRAKGPAFPTGENGWLIKDGLITIQSANGAESKNAGDIVSSGEYATFELVFDFRLTKGAIVVLNTLSL